MSMSENQEEIKTGDVVCLKSDKSDPHNRKFTVGSTFTGGEVNIHWFVSGELRTAKVNKNSLHKIS